MCPRRTSTRRRRERLRRQRPHARVRGRVEEEHLADHDLGDGCQRLHPEGGQLLGASACRSAEKSVRTCHHVVVAGDDPRVEEGVPVHGGLVAQPVVERVRVGEHRGVEQLVQAQAAVGVTRRLPAAVRRRSFVGARRGHQLLDLLVGQRSDQLDDGVVDDLRHLGQRRIVEDRPAGSTSTPKRSRTRATSCAPISEWPPSSKKLSSRPNPSMLEQLREDLGERRPRSAWPPTRLPLADRRFGAGSASIGRACRCR